MYLCAQRVQDPSGSRPIVGQCHLHRSSAHPERLNDVRWVAQQEPGELIGTVTAGKGGGRAVLSFLDLTGPDAMTRDQTEQVLGEYRAALIDGQRGPFQFGRAGAELYVGATIDFVERIAEFDALRGVISRLIDFAVGTTPSPRGLKILASREGERLVMRWDDASRDLIRAEVPGWPVPTFSIDDTTRHNFEYMFGSIYPVALDALSPLRRDRLQALGGAAIVDANTRSTLWVTEEP